MEAIYGIASDAHIYLASLAIAMSRMMAIFTVSPIMTRLGLPIGLRGFVVVALALPVVVPITADPQIKQTLAPMFIVSLCLKEVVVGVLLGIVTGFPFWAMEIAGNIVDFVRQAPDAQVQDPLGTTQTSLTGTLFAVFATLYFVTMGGLKLFMNAIYTSFEVWPALSSWPDISSRSAMKCVEFLDSLLRASLLIAAPFVVFIMIAFLLVAIISRIIPQVNVFILSMSFRNAAFVIAVQVFGLYIISNFTSNGVYMRDAIPILKGFFE